LKSFKNTVSQCCCPEGFAFVERIAILKSVHIIRLGFEVDTMEHEQVVSLSRFHFDSHMYLLRFIFDSLVTSISYIRPVLMPQRQDSLYFFRRNSSIITDCFSNFLTAQILSDYRSQPDTFQCIILDSGRQFDKAIKTWS